MNSVPPVVHVIDDDEAFRVAVARLLRACGYQVSLYRSADHFLERTAKDEAGCILLDIRMPGLSGLELQDRLQKLDSLLPIVFLTGHGDVPTSVRAIKAGAEDLLLKPVGKEVLLETIDRALQRYLDRRRQHDRLSALRALVDGLTPREREVFGLLVRGKLNKQIAYELGTSERTIKAHRHSIMNKLNVSSFAEAVTIAERLGILTDSDKENATLRR
jgi:FixJ family two-component response regulator